MHDAVQVHSDRGYILIMEDNYDPETFDAKIAGMKEKFSTPEQMETMIEMWIIATSPAMYAKFPPSENEKAWHIRLGDWCLEKLQEHGDTISVDPNEVLQRLADLS